MTQTPLPPTTDLAQTLLAQTAQAWLAGDAQITHAMLDKLAPSTGIHAASLRQLITLWAQTHTPDALGRFIQASPAGWQPIGTVAMVAPGNMPVATWQLLAWAWLTGNRVRLRPSRGDPYSASNLLRAVQLVAQRQHVQLHDAAWLTEVAGDPSDPLVAQQLLSGADALVIMGGDQAVEAWSNRAHSLGFAGPVRGHDARHSASLLGPEADLTAVAPLLAHDALLADGRGCLSLRTVLVVGHSGMAVHTALGTALEQARLDWPQGTMAPHWLAERQLLADTLALRSAMGEPIWLRNWPDALLVTCPIGLSELTVGWGARALLVLVCPNWQVAAQWLAAQPRLTALAVAGVDTDGQRLVDSLPRSVARTVPGALQAPDVARWPDGWHPHAALVRSSGA